MTLPKRDLKTSSYKMNMNKKNLKKLSKSKLIKLLLKQDENGQAQKQIANEFENSIVSLPKQEESLPRKSINNYKCLIIETPEQFRDRPQNPLESHHYLHNRKTLSILTMAYSKPKTKALRNSKLSWHDVKIKIKKSLNINIEKFEFNPRLNQ